MPALFQLTETVILSITVVSLIFKSSKLKLRNTYYENKCSLFTPSQLFSFPARKKLRFGKQSQGNISKGIEDMNKEE